MLAAKKALLGELSEENKGDVTFGEIDENYWFRAWSDPELSDSVLCSGLFRLSAICNGRHVPEYGSYQAVLGVLGKYHQSAAEPFSLKGSHNASSLFAAPRMRTQKSLQNQLDEPLQTRSPSFQLICSTIRLRLDPVPALVSRNTLLTTTSSMVHRYVHTHHVVSREFNNVVESYPAFRHWLRCLLVRFPVQHGPTRKHSKSPSQY